MYFEDELKHLLMIEEPGYGVQQKSICRPANRKLLLYMFAIISTVLTTSAAVCQDSLFTSTAELKKLSIEELLNLEVTLVSRSPQKLAKAASAVQIITGESIRNSGAENLADALRLATNLQVAQLNANAWLISARGFNSLFANKLLVMIDGRTVYTPLFGGVLWDLQNVLMEDIDRIEVVSGPGGSLWGANAVNGVINIITKSAKDTKGFYASVLKGSFVRDHFSARWGGRIGSKINYKIYGQQFKRNPTELPNGNDYNDASKLTQSGFRLDWTNEHADTYTLQGDYYRGKINTRGKSSAMNGQNILGRWSRKISETSDLTLQLYFDRYFKADAPNLTSDKINTFDLDFQYRFQVAKRHSILSGVGYRLVIDDFASESAIVAILPEKKNLDLFNAFVQDEILITERLKLTAGTKLLHNVYSGFELQPGLRLGLSLTKNNFFWAAVSRSVRSPSRVDADYFSPPPPLPPTQVSIAGGPNFKSEKALSYELGYRIQPDQNSSLSIAGFYNVYRDVYSLENLPGTLTYQMMNGSQGNSWGVELAGTYQLTPKWRLRSGYTYFDIRLKEKAGHQFDPSYLVNDVKNQAMVQSMTDLPYNLHLHIFARYLDYIPKSLVTIQVPSYFTFDTRLAYNLKFLTISVVGQNLYSRRHREFNNLSIPRSIYAKIAARF